MEMLAQWSFVPLIALAIPSILALAAVASPRRAGLASKAALGLALIFSLAVALPGAASAEAGAALGVRVDAPTCVMLLLVAALGTVIVGFSRTYLHGELGVVSYLRWLLLTLSAVTALVVVDNLLLIAVFWTATSLALHQLLTFYSDRTAALVAAHKKFLVSRLADGCLLGCLALVHTSVGSFNLDDIAAWVAARPDLPLLMEAAAVLLVTAVALRSAQLPFHGWLTQVMEAPTPVSALLHAGVVNIGGFVLIRLAPWIAHAQPARLLLVVIGLVSTTVAALVMTTRVSVKVALAWSTCAQMGFMLVQCGLGLWSLALLHLVAHSLYKAHAFLSAGSVVDDWRMQALLPARARTSLVHLGLAVLMTVGAALFAVTVLRPHVGLSLSHGHSELVLALLVGLSTVPLLATGTTTGARAVVATAPRLLGVVLLYLGWHALAQRLLPAGLETANPIGWAMAAVGFAGLFAVKATLQLNADSRFARALHPWLFSGLYLDELFTKLTFRVWPPRLPQPVGSPSLIQSPAALEVRA
jgi:NAD(P)H-quinone oxidoreductase subunit 5